MKNEEWITAVVESYIKNSPYGRATYLPELDKTLGEVQDELTTPKCNHHHGTTANMKYSRCNNCGMILTDSGWGIASNMWFNSEDEAEFYKRNGRLPK